MSVTTAAWLWVLAGGVFEVAWAVGLKHTHGFTRLWPSVLVGAAVVASFWCLAQGLKHLPTGTGYAVWVGVGALGAAAWGMAMEGEPTTLVRLACLGLIVAGVAGLKLSHG